jgi:hypothetical protein
LFVLCWLEKFVPAHSIAGRAMTKALVRGADLIGFLVVDASTGDDVADVRNVVFEELPNQRQRPVMEEKQ